MTLPAGLFGSSKEFCTDWKDLNWIYHLNTFFSFLASSPPNC